MSDKTHDSYKTHKRQLYSCAQKDLFSALSWEEVLFQGNYVPYSKVSEFPYSPEKIIIKMIYDQLHLLLQILWCASWVCDSLTLCDGEPTKNEK